MQWMNDFIYISLCLSVFLVETAFNGQHSGTARRASSEGGWRLRGRRRPGVTHSGRRKPRPGLVEADRQSVSERCIGSD